MRYITKKRIKVIHQETAEGFEREMNSAYASIKGNVRTVFNMAQGFCAYLTYEEDEAIPENIRDEYILNGERFRCFECPFYVPPEDKRRRHGSCKLKAATAPDDDACLHFYKQYSLGNIEPKKGGAE